jgi:hypothetical protein
MHRLLDGPFLKSPRIMRARELMPTFGLGKPSSSILGVGPGALQAPQFHDAAIIVAHRTPLSFSTSLFLLLRQSHYVHAAELFWVFSLTG